MINFSLPPYDNEPSDNDPWDRRLRNLYTTIRLEPVHPPTQGDSRDHSNLSHLLRHADLSPIEHAHLDAIAKKCENFPTTFGRPDYCYAQQASIIALSTWDDANKVAGCKVRWGSKRRCNQWEFCPVCAYIAYRKKLAKLASRQSCIEGKQWALITCSFQETLSTDMEEEEEVRMAWDAGVYAIKKLKAKGRIRGAIIRQEMAVSFSPTQVRPHVHALVELADRVEVEDVENVLLTFMEKIWATCTLTPSVNIQPVESNWDNWKRVLHYLYKPIDLHTPYRAARFQADTLDAKEWLNVDVNEFLEAASYYRQGRRQLNTIGSLRGS